MTIKVTQTQREEAANLLSRQLDRLIREYESSVEEIRQSFYNEALDRISQSQGYADIVRYHEIQTLIRQLQSEETQLVKELRLSSTSWNRPSSIQWLEGVASIEATAEFQKTPYAAKISELKAFRADSCSAIRISNGDLMEQIASFLATAQQLLKE